MTRRPAISAAAVPPRARLRTYSHLAEARRVPSEYAIVTSRLLWSGPDGAAEVATPVDAWYARYQRGSALQATDWERFSDPRETTYTRYTAERSRAEAVTAHILARIEMSDYDEALAPDAQRLLAEAVAPLRYPWHGLQMIAAYVAQMAPAGRIVIAAALQAADEVRRIQRIAYRMALRRRIQPDFGDDSRARWERDPSWQPLREALERMLVAWDWAEAFAAINLCLKPLLDRLALSHLGAEARVRGDYLLAELLASLEDDARWHREWSRALVRTVVADRPENRDVLAEYIATWLPLCARAARSLGDAWMPDRFAAAALAGDYETFHAALELPPVDPRALETIR